MVDFSNGVVQDVKLGCCCVLVVQSLRWCRCGIGYKINYVGLGSAVQGTFEADFKIFVHFQDPSFVGAVPHTPPQIASKMVTLTWGQYLPRDSVAGLRQYEELPTQPCSYAVT